MIGRTSELVFVVLSCALSVTGIQHQSTCLGHAPAAVNISCPAGHMVQIIRVLHGYTTVQNCSYTRGDCTKRQNERYDCVGMQNCSIHVAGSILMPACRKMSNYLQVEYTCIAASQVYNICDNTTRELTSSSGYIASPNYPQRYEPSLDCQVTVKVHPEQTIKIDVIDMNLRDSQYYDCLMMTNHISSRTWCNSFANEHVFESRGNDVELKFSSNGQEEAKGFWVFYRATPEITQNGQSPNTPETTTKSTTTTTTTQAVVSIEKTAPTTQRTPPPTTQQPKVEETTSQSKTSKDGDAHIKQNRDEPSDSDSANLPVGAIIGVVLGGLILVMLILIGLLVVRRLRERRRKRSESLHMIFTGAQQKSFYE